MLNLISEQVMNASHYSTYAKNCKLFHIETVVAVMHCNSKL